MLTLGKFLFQKEYSNKCFLTFTNAYKNHVFVFMTVPKLLCLSQRNQIPGPMSPRFSGMQHQQHPNLSQLIRPGPSTPNSSQMSPHFNQQPPQNQWNMRQQQPQQQAMQSPISSNVPKVRAVLSNLMYKHSNLVNMK